MSRIVELPDAVFAALDQVARESGTTAADWIAAHLPQSNLAAGPKMPPSEDWLDHDFLKTYSRDADDSVSLEAVRNAMAKIPGRLADDIRADRDER